MVQKTYTFTVETDSKELINYLAQACDYGDKEADYSVKNNKRTGKAMSILTDIDQLAFEMAEVDHEERIKLTLNKSGTGVQIQQ